MGTRYRVEVEGSDWMTIHDTIHDTIHVGGVSESCKYNDHDQCRAPGCGCTCHTPAPTITEQLTKAAEVGPENACPTCGVKRPSNELFCRIDGSRLTSLACNMCGRGMNPEDKFCFNCGAPKGTVGLVKIPQVVTVPQVEVPTVGYEQQVLRGLQEELSSETREQTQEVVGSVVREVVEQPSGSQGSFKLVSKPNPNKIRGPVTHPVTQERPAIRPAIRLPIKPT